ncbi:M64 family metallo-endopeptidase, partial [candidate division KSB1 bacterium]|nr:M64 family metallo-endopeptidase [candidate division KSB1 bacterium]
SKKPVLLVFERRNKKNILEPLYSIQIDPGDYHIYKEKIDPDILVIEALVNGDPHVKVDLAWIAEGYTAQEFDKFKKDVDRFMTALFEVEPYDRLKNRFNIYGVFRPSAESGVDQPREGIFKETIVNSSFNALDLDRYLLTEDNKSMQDIASVVPFDAIVIMVNSERYGGGGIYNFYGLSTVDNQLSENVFIHEFGHSFAGLGDENYASDVAYNDFYPKGVEPTDPNITALLDPENIKWKDLVSPGIAIPTKWGKEEIEALQAELQKNKKEMREQVAQLEKSGASKTKIEKIKVDFQKKSDEINKKIDQVKEQYSHLSDKVGAFEGAGYSANGLYRPMMNCLMFGNRERKFCKVCQRAIERMIEFYSE